MNSLLCNTKIYILNKLTWSSITIRLWRSVQKCHHLKRTYIVKLGDRTIAT